VIPDLGRSARTPEGGCFAHPRIGLPGDARSGLETYG
jgi:hypothetical protein